jgi:lantibiotic modifying enzyme
VGGFVYALARSAEWLDEPALLEEAFTAASLITPTRVAADRSYDVITGSAGAIPGLLMLHAATGGGEPLDRAVACGRHLVASRTAGESGLRAWSTFRGRRLAGFAHGVAGIACALLRLYAATGEAAFRDAAAEAIRYEDGLFSPASGNWRDLRAEEPAAAARDGLIAAWCHGGPGIALARLGGLAGLDTPEIRLAIERGIGAALRHDLEAADSLCCGNMGRVEILIEAGRRLSRPEWVDAAHARAARVVRRARQRGSYRFAWDVPEGIAMPGMFQGVGGIGCALLRLAAPDRLPSVLLGA